ncbi:MAG: hypothetical protein HY608_03880 [Planctomycetes bacterium]|nr:hypothetical protein [Planctomycetota bacterium]
MSRVIPALSTGFRLEPFRLGDARAQAREIVARAGTEAAAILAQAHASREAAAKEADALREAARAEGREEGRKEGLASGEEAAREALSQALAERIDKTAEALAAIVRSAREAAELLAPEAEAFLVRLSLAIARKILGREASADRQALERAVREAAAGALSAPALRIRLHPDTLRDWGRDLPRLAKAIAGIAGLCAVADPSVEPYGCVVESPEGAYDAQISTQLTAIERHLLGGVS